MNTDRKRDTTVWDVARAPTAAELDLYLSGKADEELKQWIVLKTKLDRGFSRKLVKLQQERKSVLNTARDVKPGGISPRTLRLSFGSAGLVVLLSLGAYFGIGVALRPTLVSASSLGLSASGNSTLEIIAPGREPLSFALTGPALDQTRHLDFKLPVFSFFAGGPAVGLFISGPSQEGSGVNRWVSVARLLAGKNTLVFTQFQPSASEAQDWEIWIERYIAGLPDPYRQQLPSHMQRYSPLQFEDADYQEIAKQIANGKLPKEVDENYKELLSAYFDDVMVLIDGKPVLEEDFDSTPPGDYPLSLYNFWSGRDGYAAQAPGKAGTAFRCEYYTNWNRHDGIPLREADFVAQGAKRFSYSLRFMAASQAGASMGFSLPVFGGQASHGSGLYGFAAGRANLQALDGWFKAVEYTYPDGICTEKRKNSICRFEPHRWYRVEVVLDISNVQIPRTAIQIWDESSGQQQPRVFNFDDLGYFPPGAVKPSAPNPTESWQFTWFTFGGNYFGEDR